VQTVPAARNHRAQANCARYFSASAGEHGMALSLGADRFRVGQSGDGAADLFLVDDPVVGPLGGQKVHHRSLPDRSMTDHPIKLDGDGSAV
jgi:hypothetical protein